MVEYRLIKEYPGSPKLGTKVNYSDKHQIYNYNGGNFYTELPKHQVENLPEFWEKVDNSEELLKEAALKYPKGTKYIAANRVNLGSRDTTFTNGISTGKFDIVKYYEISGKEIFHITGESNKSVYLNGEWAEIIQEPKEYEILSYECLYSNGTSSTDRQIFVKQSNGDYKWSNVTITEKFIDNNLWNNQNGGYVIHSVKRLSDGEMFTLGDFVYEKTNVCTTHWKITEFSLKDTRCFTCGVNINNIEQEKKPLLVTEDGKEIFEDDYFWHVDKYYEIGRGICTHAHTKLPNFKDFSTKEAAEKYIDENKPKYSKKDVLGIVSKCSSGTVVGGSTIINYGFLQSYLKNDKTK